MAGYIGSKAVNLSTTGADINGDANIDGDLSFGDNDKAIFGAGSDLQIYHDGSNSFISDQGTGNLKILADDFRIRNAADTASYIFINSGAEVGLTYNGATKLATTATGVDITGTLTSDGLTVDGAISQSVTAGTVPIDIDTNITSGEGSVDIIRAYTVNDEYSAITLVREGSTNTGLAFTTTGTSTPAETMRIDSSGNVGIGFSNPDAYITDNNSLVVKGQLRVQGVTNTAAVPVIGVRDDNTGFYLPATNTLGITTNGSEAMRIDSSGNLLVGKTAQSIGTDGVTIVNGQITATSDGADAIRLNRKTSDGSIIDLRKDGTTVGSIGTGSGRIAVGNGDTFVTFAGDLDALYPASSSQTTPRDNAVSIGTSGTRFKDLYLSGKIAASNSSSLQFGSTSCAIEGTSSGADYIKITTNSSEAMRLDASGNLLVGKTSTSINTAGSRLIGGGAGAQFTADATEALALNRLTNDGDLIWLGKAGTKVGSIGNAGAHMCIGTGDVGWFFAANIDAILPTESDGTQRDGVIDLGASSHRFDDIYATNGTIQTSDRNEKQDIEVLSDAEQRVAVAAKGLLRKFRWRDAVAEKGGEARTHFGIIAQDLQAAFAAEGLDAGDYAMFMSSTWTDEETGEERTRMGVRYSELLAFIVAAI